MSARRLLKLLHLCGTAWFSLATVYVFTLALRENGVGWGMIFLLVVYWMVLLFLLISAYLYTLFGDSGSNRSLALEHPLTHTRPYMAMYFLVPFLGALLGPRLFADHAINTAIAMGTLTATAFFWVIVDPGVGFIEMLLPARRKHRLARYAAAKAARDNKQRENEQILSDLETQERIAFQQWQEVLCGEAKKLAAFTTDAIDGSTSAESEAIEIGLRAWQYGGLVCMRKLCEMAGQLCRQRGYQDFSDEYISALWDGIGQWRHKLLM
jgi:hypothetical protein